MEINKHKLSQHIKFFRPDRPSEWLMDDFERQAKKLEDRIIELELELELLTL